MHPRAPLSTISKGLVTLPCLVTVATHREDCLMEMKTSIRKDFGGIGMWGHRDDLIKHLDFIHGEL